MIADEQPTNYFSMGSSAAQGISSMVGSVLNYNAQKASIKSSIKALKAERDYNVKNFRQGMADTLAANKMSFYSSGLEQKGTAQQVTASNLNALQDDLKYMQDTYEQQIKQLKIQQKANKRKLIGDIVGTTAGTAAQMAMVF